VHAAIKKTPLQKNLNIFKTAQRFYTKCLDVIKDEVCYRWTTFDAILLKLAQIMRLFVSSSLFSSEQASVTSV